jgi:putative membrane protein
MEAFCATYRHERLVVMGDVLKLIIKGGFIGIANIIPGVSGGTMAVILGIYEDLIEAIGNFITRKEKRKEYLLFLLKVFIGAGISIIIFSWLMDYLLTYYESFTYLFFIGLIAGSLPAIYKTHSNMDLNVPSVITFLAGFSLVIFLSISFPEQHTDSTRIAVSSTNFWKGGILFFAGILSGGSMIVPGISGSFILVLLGQYHTVIRAVKNVNVVLLLFLGTGIAIGIWVFAKLMDILLKKYPKETFYFIIGLVCASLYPIFPALPEPLYQKMIAFFIALVAAVVSYKLGEIH